MRAAGSKALIQETNRAAKGSASQPLTLPEQDVTHGCVDVVIHRVSTVDHQTIHKLHGLGTLTPEFARHNDLAALGTAFHDEAEDTIAGPAGRGAERATASVPLIWDISAKSNGIFCSHFKPRQTHFNICLFQSSSHATPSSVSARQSNRKLHTVLALSNQALQEYCELCMDLVKL